MSSVPYLSALPAFKGMSQRKAEGIYTFNYELE